MSLTTRHARMKISPAQTPEQIASARILFEEYASSLGIDLAFQNFTTELAELPGAYAPPRGRLLLAHEGTDLAGCVALRPLGENICEMKRLYVRSNFRGHGIGKQLAERIVLEARSIGYQIMRLDTLASLRQAIGLYESLGFGRCKAYNETPLTDTVFMELQL